MPEANEWVGFDVDDLGGSKAGRVEGLQIDADSGDPVWLLVKLGRRRGKLVAVPMRNCAAAARRVWVAHPRETLRSAPAVDPSRPLLREHELAICAHYGIGDGVGRAAEVGGRPASSVTAKPLAVASQSVQ